MPSAKYVNMFFILPCSVARRAGRLFVLCSVLSLSVLSDSVKLHMRIFSRMARTSKTYPSHNNELEDKIFSQLRTGVTLRAVCAADDVPVSPSTVYAWVASDLNGCAERYAAARNVGMDNMADELLHMVGQLVAEPEEGKARPSSEQIQAVRLAVDTMKWYLSKLAPKRYGDKLALTDADGGQLTLVHRLVEGRRRLSHPEPIEAEYTDASDQPATSVEDMFS